MMDCTTCRTLFSESLDGRLDAGGQQALDGHVESCPACATEHALYRQVFEAVRSLPVEPAPHFDLPIEPPGMDTPRVVLSIRRWSLQRVAAAIVIGIGLISTHVLVFKWSQESADGPPPHGSFGGSAPVVAAVNYMLPSELRDHVEANDLFLRTAAQMPDSMGQRGLNLLRADMARSDLGQLGHRLSASPIEKASPESSDAIRRYLRESDAFMAEVSRVLDNPAAGPAALQFIRFRAKTSPLAGTLESMRPVVAPLAAGAAFRARVDSPTVLALFARLNGDEKTFLDAKQDRLCGEFRKAIDGYAQFDGVWRESPVAPVARYLKAEALYQTGSVSEMAAELSRFTEEWGAPALPNDPLGQFTVFINGANHRSGVTVIRRSLSLGGGQSFRIQIFGDGMGVAGLPTPMKSPMTVEAPDPSPRLSERIREFCRENNLRLEILPTEGERAKLLLFDQSTGQPLSITESSRLYDAAARLLEDADMQGVPAMPPVAPVAPVTPAPLRPQK